MRVLMVASVDASVPNACVMHLDGVASALSRAGHTVTLILPRPARGQRLQFPENTPYTIELQDYGARFGIPRFLSFLMVVPSLIRRNWRKEIDVAYIRSGVVSWVAVAALRLSGAAKVVTEHNGWIKDELEVIGRWPGLLRLAEWFQVLDARYSHLVRCVSQGLVRKMAAKGVRPGQLAVIGNGTDLSRFHPIPRAQALAARNLPEDHIYIGFIGSVASWHGLHIAMQALPAIVAAHPNVHFLVAGDGAERARNESLAASLGVADHVTFLGHVPTEQANAVINCFDLALAPFISQRNSDIGLSPLKIRDYAAAGRAILSTEIEGVAPVDDREWIAICAPDDVESLTREAIRLLGDQEERLRLATASRGYSEVHFGWNCIGDMLLQRIEQL